MHEVQTLCYNGRVATNTNQWRIKMWLKCDSAKHLFNFYKSSPCLLVPEQQNYFIWKIYIILSFLPTFITFIYHYLVLCFPSLSLFQDPCSFLPISIKGLCYTTLYRREYMHDYLFLQSVHQQVSWFLWWNCYLQILD